MTEMTTPRLSNSRRALDGTRMPIETGRSAYCPRCRRIDWVNGVPDGSYLEDSDCPECEARTRGER